MKTTIFIFFLLLGSGLFQNLKAQSRSRFNVDEICAQAQKLPLEEGIALLESNLDNCQNSSDESACRLKMNFTAGYLYQLASSKSGGSAQAILGKSLGYYQKAHETDPKNLAVLNNLIMVNKLFGNSEAALHLLDRALELDPGNRAKYLTNKGEIVYAREDLKSAIGYYKRAYFADPKNEALVWKIFSAYNRLPNQEEAYEAVFKFSGQLFDAGHYDLARAGFLNAIGNALAFEGYEKATGACIRWAEVLATKNQLNELYAGELPDLKSWNSTCNEEIQLLLTNKYGNIEQLGWWTMNEYRRHIIATILLKMESAELMRGDIEKAVQMLESALRVAPEFYVYDDPKLKNYYPVKMDIAIELSRLYNRYPQLDLDKTKYDRLIQQLFNEKSAHYLQNDPEAIQKSHTTLGLIFADRGVWESNWYAGNAIFQLEHAIQFQKQIEAGNPGKYKPIPSVYQLLAKGYQKTNQQELVAKNLVEAAAGYLDLDNLTMADSLIRAAGKASEQSLDVREKLNELVLITDMRFNIRKGNYDFKDKDVAALEGTINSSALFQMEATKNEQSFLNRQKFKILSDLGTKCSEQNPDYHYPYFEIKALDYISQEKALGNFQDINRLNQIEEKFQQNLEPDGRIQLEQLDKSADPKEQSRSWQLNSGSFQGQVKVNPDLFVAGKVYEDIQNENKGRTVEGLEQIQIKQGNVVIPKDLQDKEALDQGKIRQVKGVKDVRVTNKIRKE
ncbi:tetratricopeptide repeat protein [Mangrovibacterium lignilyticum]|uniref:tetratricopeptide repeat protein n=1 Tax=Mangrovibacterium lignilyticum TaxID=2668052 RepID=UPI0013D02706|nr:tetratricopeptide repeat protein [Mangrovibacterium lignilyticum]